MNIAWIEYLIKNGPMKIRLLHLGEDTVARVAEAQP